MKNGGNCNKTERQTSDSSECRTRRPALLRLLHFRTIRLHQVGFEHEFLVGSEINFRIEGLVSRQLIEILRWPGALCDAAKLGGVAHELSIEKDSKSICLAENNKKGGLRRPSKPKASDRNVRAT
jgi:hypothetical protein